MYPSSVLCFAKLAKCTLCCYLLLAAFGAQAEIFYKWQDESGQWVYGAHPPAGIQAIEIKTSTGRSKPASSQADSTTGDASEGEEAAESKGGELIVETKPKIPAKQQREYCEQAKGNLEALSSKAVIRRRDADGNVTVVSEKERQEEIDRANLAIDKFCK